MRSQRRPFSSTTLRPIGLPRGLVVIEDDDHMPLAVTRIDARGQRGLQGQRGSEARVESVEEVWRLAEAWWYEVAQVRTYYRVILEGGRPFTLFRDDSTGAWSEQPYSLPGGEDTR